MLSSPNSYMTAVQKNLWLVAKESAQSNPQFPADAPTTTTWYKSGRISSAGAAPPAGSPYLIPWGQIFKANGATINPDMLIKFGNIKLFVYSIANAAWTQVLSQARPAGSQYDSTFVDTTTVVPFNVYSASPNLFITDVVSGRFAHFFPSSQWLSTPSDNGGVLTVFEAKLISKTGANIESEVGTILGSTGADCRTTPSADPTGDLFISSFKPLTTSLRRFYGTTLRLPQLVTYGLPNGIEQLTQIDPQGIDPDYIAA